MFAQEKSFLQTTKSKVTVQRATVLGHQSFGDHRDPADQAPDLSGTETVGLGRQAAGEGDGGQVSRLCATHVGRASRKRHCHALTRGSSLRYRQVDFFSGQRLRRPQ